MVPSHGMDMNPGRVDLQLGRQVFGDREAGVAAGAGDP